MVGYPVVLLLAHIIAARCVTEGFPAIASGALPTVASSGMNPPQEHMLTGLLGCWHAGTLLLAWMHGCATPLLHSRVLAAATKLCWLPGAPHCRAYEHGMPL